MMVDVCGQHQRNETWVTVKTIRCSKDDAPMYVKMLFDLGFDKVVVR